MMKKRDFQKILTQHKDSVYSYARYLCKNREDAEDVTQDVFIRLWKHWDGIQPHKRRAWMMRVAHNRCMDLLRKNRPQNTADDLSHLPNQDAAFCPEKAVLQSDDHATLIEAMSTLSPKTQSLLLMHYFQDLKYETIAETMNLSVPNIKIIIHRGKKKLRTLLENHYSEQTHGTVVP